MLRFCALKSGSSVLSMSGCSCFQPYGTKHENYLAWQNIHVGFCRKLPHLARNNIIVPYSLDTHKNSTVSKSVTQKFLNPLHRLYIKKSCKFLQSYEKSRAKQKNLFFFLPSRSKFAISDGKVMKKSQKLRRKEVENLLRKQKIRSVGQL